MVLVVRKGHLITIDGHANYEIASKDIVCASLSSIVNTTVNAILKLDKGALKYEEASGHISLELLKSDQVMMTLLDNMMETLADLASQYPDNVKIIDK